MIGGALPVWAGPCTLRWSVFFSLHSRHSPDPPQAHLRCKGGLVSIAESDHVGLTRGPPTTTSSATRSASRSKVSLGSPRRRPLAAAVVLGAGAVSAFLLSNA